jgi:hypothetical protein
MTPQEQIHDDGIEILSHTFRHSSQLDQLFDALSKAQKEMSGAVKDKRAQIKNEKANYSYAYSDLESVMDACRPALNNNGICVVQPIATNGNRVTVTTLLGHKSGQWIASDLEMASGMSTPQATGSTITYGRRYGLQSMAGIASEDDDGAAGSSRPVSQPNTTAYSRPEPSPPVPPPANRPGAQYAPPNKANGATAVASTAPPPAAVDNDAPQKVKDAWERMGTKVSTIVPVFQERKKEIDYLTGSDIGYYAVLSRHQMKHANDCTAVGVTKARACMRELIDEIEKLKVMLTPPPDAPEKELSHAG